MRAAEEVEDLTAAMTPDISIPTPPVVLQARRNAEARAALLEEFGALTASEVADLAGSEAKNIRRLRGAGDERAVSWPWSITAPCTTPASNSTALGSQGRR